MKIDTRVKQIEDKLGIGSQTQPFVLLLGCKDNPEPDEAERQRLIEDAIRRDPKAKFIMLLC